MIEPTVKTAFRQKFGYTPPHLVAAPISAELLGTSELCADGLAITVSLDRRVSIALAPRTDGRVELISAPDGASEHCAISNIILLPRAANSPLSAIDLMKAVLLELRQQGVHCGGFSAALQDLSPHRTASHEAAALSVACALALRHLRPYTLTETGTATPPKRDKAGNLLPLTLSERKAVTHLCRRALVKCGLACCLAAPMTSLAGKAFQALEIDGQSLALEYLPFAGEVALLLCALEGLEPVAPELTPLCQSALNSLGLATFRRLDRAQLKANKARLTEAEFACAQHVSAEIQRVIFASRALREGDFGQFGQYLYQSHDSWRGLLSAPSSPIDRLIQVARAQPDCLGARRTTLAGVGTINLVRSAGVRSFVAAMTGQVGPAASNRVVVIPCQVVDGP